MTNETLELILEQHDIHPTFWSEMKALVFDHVRPSKALLTRLHHVANYKAAFDAILAELSKRSQAQVPAEALRVSGGAGMSSPTDFTGRAIEAGHVVVYPVRRGSDMRMKKLTVSHVYDQHITGTSPAGRT